MCGDLYPEEPERKIILGAIQAYCGPPQPKKLNLPTGDIAYFNNWRSSDKVKHKGCAVGDLEKARLDPPSWGVSGLANHSGERPARPVRAPPTLQSLQSKVQAQDAPSQAIVPAGDSEPPGGKGPGGKGPGGKGPGDEETQQPAGEETQQHAGEDNGRQSQAVDDEQANVLRMISEQEAKLKAAQNKLAAIREMKKAKKQADKTEAQAAKVGVIATHPIATHPIATHPIATHSITIFSAASCWQVPMPLHMISDAM